MPVLNQSRQSYIRIIIAIFFFIIIARLFALQVLSGKYLQLAEKNAILRKIVYPSRGIIYDRNGKAILDNITMYDLVVTPANVRGTDTATICRILNIDSAEFHRRIITAIIKNKSYRPSVFEPLLTPDKYAKLQENLYRLTGFDLVERPVRAYPYGSAAHLLGYIREVDQRMIEESGNFYQPGDYAGRSGLERYYEIILMGIRGVQYQLKDNFNRPKGAYENGAFDTAAVAGRNLDTYLDIGVQQLAEKLLGNKIGSIVAIEPKTGGIIAMASGPSFDPNLLTGPDSRSNFNHLYLDPAKPMLNRPMQGVYPPGSTFKPLGALIALDEGIIDPGFGYPCLGRYGPCGRPACEHKNPGHAANLRLAIANSCNSYFAHVFRLSVDNRKFGNIEAGLSEWEQYLNNFGLGHRLGVDLPGEYKGNVPDTNRYNNPRIFGKGRWNSCTIASLGIGQGELQVTPLQMANAMCLISNRGYYYIPHVVKEIEGETKEDTILSKYRRKITPVHISPEDFQAVIDGMEQVTLSGTATRAKIEGIDMCAKTGTVENYAIVNGKREKQPNHSFFVAFAPKDDPKIAIAVVVENAGFGATWAAPIASLVMEKYLKDSIAGDFRKSEVERIANADLIPALIKRKYAVQDSLRKVKEAQDKFEKGETDESADKAEQEENEKRKQAPEKDTALQKMPAVMGYLETNTRLKKPVYLR